MDISMQVLEIITKNEGRPADEIISAISDIFPKLPYKAICGYLYKLQSKEYISVLNGDNKIIHIGVNYSAYEALCELQNGSDKPNNAGQTFNIGQVHGQIAMGNSGGAYNFNMSVEFIQAMDKSLKDILVSIDEHLQDKSAESEEIKSLVKQILEALRKSEAPPKGVIERFDACLQKHSWISAPIASTLLNKVFHVLNFMS